MFNHTFFSKKITRKDFIKKVCRIGISCLLADFFITKPKLLAEDKNTVLPKSKEALFYKTLENNVVQCELCPHRCILSSNQRSFCRVREARNGKLYTLAYENPCAIHVDPIEKKPIFHMLPGTSSFSIATAGCNSRCKYCQNWQISQAYPEDTDNIELSVVDVVISAQKNNCRSIAYTYSEPTVFYEYMLEASKLAQLYNIKNIFVTGGMINKKPVKLLSQYIDAAHVDLKGFDQDYLKKTCSQNLNTILDCLLTLRENKVWVEIINLVVPTLNDNFKMIQNMCKWIYSNLGPDVPLHFSRFYPTYKLKNLPPTPLETLVQAAEIAKSERLRYIYIGNVTDTRYTDTYCPFCNSCLIKRKGYTVTNVGLIDGTCQKCNKRIAGIWS